VKEREICEHEANRSHNAMRVGIKVGKKISEGIFTSDCHEHMQMEGRAGRIGCSESETEMRG
jgi:replicative superfamily II helicase